jgi:iron-sulfur cluster assembly accessory protein
MVDVTITDKAAEYILNIISDNEFENCYLELDVFNGGCSGYQYRLGLIDCEPEIDDIIVTVKGINILINKSVISLVNGSEIDMVQDGASMGFKVNNPNEVKGCGCGQSFSTGDGTPAQGCSSCSHS